MRSLKEIAILTRQVLDKMCYLNPIADSQQLAELRWEQHALDNEKMAALYRLNESYGSKYYGWAKQLQAELEEKFRGSPIDKMTESAIEHHIHRYVFEMAARGEIFSTKDADSLVVVFTESLSLDGGRQV